MELSIEDRTKLIEKNHPSVSIERQSELLGISRSTVYYQPIQNPNDKILMDEIDKIYTETPFYGQRRIKVMLGRKGYDIGRDKIRNLMNQMGLEAEYPKPKLSLSNKYNEKYPYLLRDKIIENSNEVWGTDITYVRMRQGWLYLVAILDWFSRFVLAWRLSNCMEERFCLETLKESLTFGKPEIHNSDQGSQFTGNNYLGVLKDNNIKISMDGKGRCYDNIFTERLWRTIKYEEIYLKNYENPDDAFGNLKNYFKFYNYQRPHQSLSYKTPAELYFNK